MPKVVESEAGIVQQIYQMYLNGYSISKIAKTLTTQGVPTPADKKNWLVLTINSILRNKRYKGHTLFQKTFIKDFLTTKAVKNQGQGPQYYVTDSHPKIIEPAVFELVRYELQRNSVNGKGRGSASCFFNRIKCGGCSEFFGIRMWHSKDNYKRRVWQCYVKYKERGKISCKITHLPETQLEQIFVAAFNHFIGNKEKYIEIILPVIEALSSISDLQNEEATLQERAIAKSGGVGQGVVSHK